MEFWNLLLTSFYFMLPAYFANMAPVIVKRVFNFLAKPIDNGVIISGKRLLGSHKTWRGLIFGIVFGILTAYIQSLLDLSISAVNYSNWLLIGLLMGFGALLGDMVESMIKRRLNRKPGVAFIPWDQLDFVLGSLILSAWFLPPDLRESIILTVIILSPILDILVNHISFYLGFRGEKW